MKTLAYFAAALWLAGSAWADPTRYEWRSFGVQSVDLEPVFGWWLFVSRATNEPLDITGMDSNKLVEVSNLWQHLPARPLPEWSRILASEDQISVAGAMWKLNATIEPAPMMVRHETIYLRNPPVKEIQNYKQARDAYNALESAQASDVASEQYMQSNVQAQATALWAGSSTNAAARNIYNQAYALEYTSGVTISNLNAAQARTQARDTQMAPLQKFLATFPDTNTYWLDHFAYRTGKKIGGIEVYDLGSAEGLTY